MNTVAESLRCIQCPAQYPIIDGIPILIVEERSVFRLAQFAGHQPTTIPPKSFRDRVVTALPTITLNIGGPRHWRMLADLLNSQAGKKTVLVIGSGDGGSVPRALAPVKDLEIVYSDVSLEARGIQLICDAHDIPFESASFDAVVAQAVLEHVADPNRCVEEFHRVLKPGGVVYAETPFMQQAFRTL